MIASCYGFGRYAYGLFAPDIADHFAMSATAIGVVGGASTLGYTVGLLLAPRLTAMLSARAAVVLASGIASTGLSLAGVSGDWLPVFVIGLLTAGVGAGLVSPGVAQLIARSVATGPRSRAQTWANTGTSLGLAVSSFAPALVFGWQVTWLGFGAAAALVTALAWRTLPRAAEGDGIGRSGEGWRRPGLTLLLVNSVLLGFTSAPYWNFSVDQVQRAGVDPGVSGWFWLVIGVAGPIGGVVGALAKRLTLTTVNVATWMLWSAAIALLAVPGLSLQFALISAGAFGAAFMGLTGLCILWAAKLYPASPARGVTLSFLALGVGQTLGSIATGLFADQTGLSTAFVVAAGLGMTMWVQVHPRLRVQ
ncbi:MFS transporter [Pseudoclavibacter endophyticus]|uniref:YbfB/YjiJ family MFS transporter n=1 Tax=Pseudoclavibacter endophyticus TaxID=1778590 RepID=UPI00199EDCA4|nr:YbfB/YjiJ family MFS transporter [Pseudoclavibacter endophyticus]GGA60222.1 MFS transporter [Pseudoclavibacter endophyticus]